MGDAAPRRVLIAGIGYQYLRDLSVGSVVIPELRRLAWPAEVEIDDWWFGPIHAVHRLEASPGAYRRIVFVSAVERGREPGVVSCYRWLGELPDADEIQRRVGEAVTGLIHLDNLLIVGEYFRAFPPDVVVVEIEPDDCGWGDGFTPRVAAAMDELVATVRRAALERAGG